jgi:hypothetical protein
LSKRGDEVSAIKELQQLTDGMKRTIFFMTESALNIDALIDEIALLHSALEILSRLGNGDQLGNSDGNRIAQKALAAIE